MKKFSNIIFNNPKFNEKPSSWIEHIPFAFFLIETLKPKVFVELGTHYGSSYFAFCQAINELEIESKAFTVDLWTGDAHSGFYGNEVFEYVNGINEQYYSSFSNLLKTSFDKALENFNNGSIDLLHIDGFHTYEAVKHDFDNWLPKMSDRGVIVLHDTKVMEKGFGVWKLMEELKEKYISFEFDHGYGLGIICIGNSVNEEFIDFLNKSKGDTFVQNLFAHLGNKNLLSYNNNLLNKSLHNINEKLSTQNGELVNISNKLNVSESNLSSENSINKFLREENKTLRNEMDVLIEQNSNKIAELENKQLKLGNSITGKNLQIVELDFKINELQNKLIDTDKSNKELTEQTNHQKTIIENTNIKLTIIESTIISLTESLSWKITKPLRLLKNNKLRAKYLLSWNKRIINKSGFFDAEYYIKNNADVGESGDDPLNHFTKYGGFEGRNPGPKFDTNYYNKQNPDVIASGINPLLHYILYGKKEGRQIIQKDKSISLSLDSTIIQPHIVTDEKNQDSEIADNSDSNKKINIIRESEFFDSDYYLRINADVKASKIDPAEHYLNHGWKEGRNPSREFNTNYYISAHDDVKVLGINPLIHYEEFGRKELRLTKMYEVDEEDCFKKADINSVDVSEDFFSDIKLAFVCHIHYTDLADELIKYLQNISQPFELFISTSQKNVNYLQNKFNNKLPKIKTNILEHSNRGRDIAPFLSILKNKLMNYDLVCKIHTKKSNHDINLKGWRKYLWDNLLGNSLITNKIIHEFIENEKLGIVWPVSFPYITHLGLESGWGSNQNSFQNLETAKKHFPELDLGNANSIFDFPQGSMFWFRPKALKLLTYKDISAHHFAEEDKQIDHTLAHAIERLFGIIVNKSGFESKTVFFPKEVLRTSIRTSYNLSNSQSILFIAHDLFRAGAEILLLNLINWLNRHTSFNLYVLALKPGNDGGKLLSDYNDVSRVILWDEYCLNYNEEDAISAIKEEIGEIDLIYGNTIIAANLYSHLKIFNAPYITHLHELEESIQRYTTQEARKTWKDFTSIHIACSSPVEENLIQKHGISKKEINCINEFIKPLTIDLPDIISQRNIHGLPTEKTIIWGCGTIYWRKGTDIFIETAKALKEKRLDNFIFYWIGGNHWDAESEEWGEWKSWEKFIIENDLSENVIFLDEKENPRDYFTSGDIFFLPSREDPFPLVCLEAAECGLPIVCFEDAGGIPEFVEKDAGKVVPFLDINAAANALEELIVNETERTEKGKNARTKLFQRHSDDIAAPQILKICHSIMQSNPLVSVIVPVYNHEEFLKERIESILNQSFRDFEIIILDDASTDNSYDIAKSYEWHPAVEVIGNKNNSGSPFLQWQKGINLAKGKYIWLAEGDDKAENSFLETLLPAFNDDEVKIAYCASHRIDDTGEIFEKHYLNAGHYDNLCYPKSRWENDYISNGLSEVKNALAIRNTLPNASATLIQADAIKNIDFNKCATFKTAGDWFAYLSILNEGKISYIASHLNYHRVHSTSVVAQNKVGPENTIPDYFEIHKFVIQNFSINDDVVDLMINSVTNNLRNIWPNMSDDEFLKYYNPDKLKAEFTKRDISI